MFQSLVQKNTGTRVGETRTRKQKNAAFPRMDTITWRLLAI